jgi:hypothetical protein
MLIAFGLKAADLEGVWKGSIDTQGGTVEMTFVLQPGPVLAGVVKSNQFGEAPIQKAKVEGDKISFEINITVGKLAFEGTVMGDDMNLAVTGTQGDKYNLNCKRLK